MVKRITTLVVAMAASTACGAAPSTLAGTDATQSSAPSVTASASPAASKELRFAGKTLTVGMTGYDTKLDMVQFQLVQYIRGGEDNGHYEPDDADPGRHRLPLAGEPAILSVISICSTGLTADSQGHANKPCTKDQLVKALTNVVPLFAQLEVDSTDHITKVSELYTP
jgi:hypothetical protein